MSRHVEKKVRSLTEIALADQPAMLLLAVIAPLLILLLTTIMGNGMVRDLPIAVCDQENSSLSRKIVRALDASPSLKIIAVVTSPEEANHLLIKGTIYGSLKIPAGFSKRIKEGKAAQIEAQINSQRFLTAGYLRREILTATNYFSVGVTVTRLTKQGISSGSALAIAAPVTADVSLIGNHSGNYRWFLIPGMLLVQLGGVLTIAAMLFSSGMVEKRIHHHSHGVDHPKSGPEFTVRLRILLTFALAYAVVVLGIIFPLTNITTASESIRAMVPVILFFVATIFMGTGIGFFFPRRINAASVGLILSMPAFIYSGYSYPQASMPEIIQLISEILPFTHLMPLWNQGVRLHYPMVSLLSEWFHLILISIIGIILTLRGIHRNDKRGIQ